MSLHSNVLFFLITFCTPEGVCIFASSVSWIKKKEKLYKCRGAWLDFVCEELIEWLWAAIGRSEKKCCCKRRNVAARGRGSYFD